MLKKTLPKQRSLLCFPISIPPESVARYVAALGLSVPQALPALARALAIAAAGLKDLGAVLLVREQPPVLALLGSFDEITSAGIRLQIRALEQFCDHLFYIDYLAVARACDRLASGLEVALGQRALEEARFAAIPRGGLVILGLLAPLLGLTSEQLSPSPDPDQLLVVVDDCAISGARFRQYLSRCDSRRIAFTPLCSPASLRRAMQAREPRLTICLSAVDLLELPEAPLPDQLERRRLRIERGDCYWLGATESLCFPWNEPDRTLWNPRTERSERAWRIVPPELCLKNRPAPGISPLPIQVQPAPGPGPLGPAESVLQAEIDGDVALCDERSGRVFRLEGAGADLWRGLAHTGDLERTLAGLRSTYDVPSEILEADARRLVEDLLARGLLVNRSTA